MELPLLVPAVKARLSSWESTAMELSVGAPGAVSGVTELLEADVGDEPTPLVATTLKV